MNEVRFKIGADTSSLSRGFAQAQSVAAAAGKRIGKSFDLKQSFNSAAIALGLSVDKIATKVADFFSGGTLDGWQSALNAAEETARLMEEASLARLNNIQQIAALEARIKQNKSEDPNPRKADFSSGWRSLFNSPGGMEIVRRMGMGGETDADAATRRQRGLAAGARDEMRRADLVEKQRRLDERVAAARRELARATMDDDQQIIDMVGEMNAAYDKVSDAILSNKDAGELNLAAIAKQKAVVEAIRAAENKTAADQKQRIEEEKRAAEERIRSAERTLEADERIEELAAGTAALGETTVEEIGRLKREALDLDLKAAEVNRSEDNRNRLRVQAAEKRAEAAKLEYDYRNKAANIEDSQRTPGGRINTTGQGVLANRAARANAAARTARGQGRFGESTRQGVIARGAEEQFQKNDRTGMGSAAAAGPDMRSAWDKKWGASLAMRNDAISMGVAARFPVLQNRGAQEAEAKRSEKDGKSKKPEETLNEIRDLLKSIDSSLLMSEAD